jgi:hypothetical protein
MAEQVAMNKQFTAFSCTDYYRSGHREQITWSAVEGLEKTDVVPDPVANDGDGPRFNRFM